MTTLIATIRIVGQRYSAIKLLQGMRNLCQLFSVCLVFRTHSVRLHLLSKIIPSNTNYNPGLIYKFIALMASFPFNDLFMETFYIHVMFTASFT